jgi:hypothetical protein
VRQAALIGNVLDFGMAEATAFEDTLNGLAAGVFLVDEGARIVFANASGQALLDEGKILCQKNGVLTAANPRIRKMLPGVIASAGDGDAAVGTSGIAVPLSLIPSSPGAPSCRSPPGRAACRNRIFRRGLFTRLRLKRRRRWNHSSLQADTTALRVLAAVSEVGRFRRSPKSSTSRKRRQDHLPHLFAKTALTGKPTLSNWSPRASPLRKTPRTTGRCGGAFKACLARPYSASAQPTVDAFIRPFFQKFLQIVSEGGLLGSMGEKSEFMSEDEERATSLADLDTTLDPALWTCARRYQSIRERSGWRAAVEGRGQQSRHRSLSLWRRSSLHADLCGDVLPV